MVKNEVPENMTLDEATEFWDEPKAKGVGERSEHCFLDYDDIEEVHFSVDLQRNRNYIDIEEDLAEQIRKVARQKGISSRVLINQWLREKVAIEQLART